MHVRQLFAVEGVLQLDGPSMHDFAVESQTLLPVQEPHASAAVACPMAQLVGPCEQAFEETK